MRVSKIRKLVKLVKESIIDELEISIWWPFNFHGSYWKTVIRITKNTKSQGGQSFPLITKPTESQSPQNGTVKIKSLKVGWCYLKPTPDSPPFIEVGQIISIGQTICIIEALKLKNGIQSEIAGRVVKICVENGKPVDFGKVLFEIELIN